MVSVSIVVRDHRGPVGVFPMLHTIDQYMRRGGVEVIVISDEATRTFVEVKGQRIRTLLVDPGKLDSEDALNLGMEMTRGEMVAFTVGDACPLCERWFEAIEKCALEPMTAILGGSLLPEAAGTFAGLVQSGLGGLAARFLGRRSLEAKALASLSPFNMAIRRQAWRDRSFLASADTCHALQGWSLWAMGQGFDLTYDWSFAVRCPSGLGRPWVDPSPNQHVSIQRSSARL